MIAWARKPLLISFFMLWVELISSLQVSACECTLQQFPRQEVQQAFRQATAIYVATVVAVPSWGKSTATMAAFQLKVTRVVKGNKSLLNRVLRADNNCQFNFQINKTYLIYADNEYSPTVLSVNKCSRTKELITAKKEELVELQKLAATAGRQ